MVDDAAQETLLTIHTRRHTYEPGRPFKAWLSGIARYKWIDHLRALERNPAAPCAEGLIDDAVSAEDHGTAVTSAIVLGDLLAQLKPAQAEAIRLVKIAGYSIEETSQRTGQSVSLVKVNIHRGLAKLGALAGAGHA